MTQEEEEQISFVRRATDEEIVQFLWDTILYTPEELCALVGRPKAVLIGVNFEVAFLLEGGQEYPVWCPPDSVLEYRPFVAMGVVMDVFHYYLRALR